MLIYLKKVYFADESTSFLMIRKLYINLNFYLKIREKNNFFLQESLVGFAKIVNSDRNSIFIEIYILYMK